MKKNLILASNSPRRKEILTKAGYNFKVIPSNYDEKISDLIYQKELVENCCYQKAKDVFENTKEDAIYISADTVVVVDNFILGKPKNKNEAIKMLENLSNKTHFVQTSICLLTKEKYILSSDITYVTFRKLNKEEIINYIDKFNPLDKAGSYGIQDENFDFVEKIEGDFNTVVGFPLKLFNEKLEEFNLSSS